MAASPALLLILRDMLGSDAQDIADDTFDMVSKAMAQVKYLDIIQGDADQITAFQFGRYESN